ncbi:MAG: hypothetical protein OHK0039_07800 [Bacteroidia bacterium]
MRYSLLFLCLILVLSACKVTQKAYERGDYETAVFNSIERLRRSPENKKASQTLAEAYPAMQTYLQEQIEQLKLSNNPLRWEAVARNYETLNRAYDEIQRSPAARRIIRSPQQYQREYGEATRLAAESRYALGIQGLQRAQAGDRNSAKDAYEHFRRALEWRPGFRDAEDRSLEALDLATIYIEVEPIPMHSRALALSNEFFENQLFEYMASSPISPFVRFVSAADTRTLRRDPDHILRMGFDDFVVGQAYVKETVMQRRRDSVVVGTVKISEDSTVNVYGTVEAEMHQFMKQISSSGLLDLRIIDGRTGTILAQRKFPGTFVWTDRWGFYQGDKRALDPEDEDFVRKRSESPNPPPQVLFVEFTKPIFSQVTAFVSDYYRGM